FAPGDEVRMRDRASDPWQQGVVESIRPSGKPVVLIKGQSRGYEWNCVELQQPEQKPASSSSGTAAEISALKAKNDQCDKTIRDQNERIKREKARGDELEKKLSNATTKVEELERELKYASPGSATKAGTAGSSAEVEKRLQTETDRRIEAERLLEQFKSSSERNAKILMSVYEEKDRLEAKLKELEKLKS
ncbi:hypothetical protein DIPPA_28895, partial [Diplonema papillatum]